MFLDNLIDTQNTFVKKTMKVLTVDDLKTNFSEVLKAVQVGEEFAIAFGKRKEVVAYLIPKQLRKKGKRKIGILEGKATAVIKDDFKISVLSTCTDPKAWRWFGKKTPHRHVAGGVFVLHIAGQIYQLSNAAAPLTISPSSVVMASWRFLL